MDICNLEFRLKSLNFIDHWFVIVYYKTLVTAFAAILKHLFYLETGAFFLQNISGLWYGKLVRMGLKGVKEV